MSTTDPIFAYCGQRAADRKTTTGERRHAITLWSQLSGAHDAECGDMGVVAVGEWVDGDPLNCPRCVAYLAGLVAVPEDVAAEHRAAARAEERRQRKLVAADRCGTLSIFAAA